MSSQVLRVWAFVSLAAGCNAAPTHVVSYVDGAGRSCSVDLLTTGSASCDIPSSAHCAGGTSAGYDLSPQVDGLLENCSACLDTSRQTTLIDSASCAQVTCVDATDCAYDGYACRASVCVRQP
jgi:hypothetical protein